MNGFLIVQGNNPYDTSFKLVNCSPEAKPVMLLRLDSNRIFDYPNAPFLLEIWPLSQDFFLKIFSEFIHSYIIALLGS